MLTIQLLGPTSVTVGDKVIQLKRRKSRALLYYIAASPQPVTRRQVAALLWSDHTDDTARHNLRTTIYSLRKELGDYLRAENEWIALENVEVDVRTLLATLDRPNQLAQLSQEELRQTLKLYRGDFLADFALPDGEEYENWIAVEREHLRRLTIRGYQLVAQYDESIGDYTAALTALSRALAIDPFQEDLQREGLRLHYFAGDRAGAIRRYEEFTRLLENEMGVQPMTETRTLYNEIITGELAIPEHTPTQPLANSQLAPAQPTQRPQQRPPLLPTPAPRIMQVQSTAPSGPPFTGRAEELHRLIELKDSHQLILLQGEAGMGKTRLAETYIGQAQTMPGNAPTPLVLVGRARQLESRLPYQPIIEALRTLISAPVWGVLRQHIHLPAIWWQEIARLLPEIVEPSPTQDAIRSPDESRLWEGVFQLMVTMAQQQPLILFLDDLQWADAATLGLLGYLVRQSAAAQLPITFLAASRPPQPGREMNLLIQALLREERLTLLRLEQLEANDVMALARWLSPNYGYPLGNWLYRSSEGTPFVLAELVRYIREEKILLPDGAVNLSLLPKTPVVPPTVYTLIQSRLATLSDAARRVLDAAVAIGREFEFEIVARAAALSDTATLDALDELRLARFIRAVDERRFAFDHSLTMEVAYQEVGELRHRLLHRRVAAALESIHEDRLDEVAGLIAEHYAEGDQPVLAAKYARVAGQRAVRLAAWKAAIGFFRQALAATPANEQPELLLSLGTSQLLAGELANAEETLSTALPLPATQKQISILRSVLASLGESMILQARYADVAKLAQNYANHSEPSIRSTAQFMWGASLTLEGQDLNDAQEHLNTSKGEALAAGLLGTQIAPVEFELGNITAQQGDLKTAVAYYERVAKLSQPDKSNEKDIDVALRFNILAYNNLAYHLHLLGDPRAKEMIQKAIHLAQEKGVLTVFSYLLSTRGEIALAEEDFSGAESSFIQALAHAQRLNQPERIAGVTANLGLLAIAQGQNELAIHRLTTALATAETISSRFLAAQICLWLAPLVPAESAANYLRQAQAIITTGHYHRLLPQLQRLQKSLTH